MIEVVDLRKSFGDNEILKGITTTLETGKINLIIGQSGSGKTVFLKSLLNVFEPTSGSILFDGRNIVEMTPKQKQELRAEIGTVFQGSGGKHHVPAGYVYQPYLYRKEKTRKRSNR